MVFFTVPMVLGIIAVGAIALPVLIGGMGVAIKVIQVLFSSPVGGFPVWALFIVAILLFVVYKKMRAKGY